jgi:DNA-binding SARP family transcriptional activator
MRIELLGHFAVLDDGRDVTPPLGHPSQLLKAVAVRGRRLHREEAVEVLWPSVSRRVGETRLRNVLSRLRAASGDVLAREGGLLVVPGWVRIDVEEFEADARRAVTLAPSDAAAAVEAAGRAVERYRGDLLPDDRYVQWTEAPRERLRRRFRAANALLVEDARRRGADEQALLLVERSLEVDPEAEEAYVEAAELLDRLGRRSGAIQVVQRGLAVMDELGVHPGPDLRSIARRLGLAEPGL